MRTLKLVAVLSVAGAMSLISAVPVQAAPITPLSAVAKPNTQDGGTTIPVRWWGWRGAPRGCMRRNVRLDTATDMAMAILTAIRRPTIRATATATIDQFDVSTSSTTRIGGIASACTEDAIFATGELIKDPSCRRRLGSNSFAMASRV